MNNSKLLETRAHIGRIEQRIAASLNTIKSCSVGLAICLLSAICHSSTEAPSSIEEKATRVANELIPHNPLKPDLPQGPEWLIKIK